VDLGPWNAEKVWDTQDHNQAAYIVPPIAHVASGPAGLAYYPGVGLPERYNGHFFLCLITAKCCV
jgi:quinoprotein glucose dehydrogenase